MQVDKGRLKAGKRKFQIVFLDHSPRKIIHVLSLMSQLINLPACWIGQAHDSTDLIIGFTDRIIASFPHNLIVTSLTDIDQLSMTAADQESQQGKLQGLHALGCHQVAGHMIDWNQWDIMSPGKGLGRCQADQKRPDQTRTVGNGHRCDLLLANPCFCQGLLNANRNDLHMVTAGHFRYHSAKTLVTLNLAGNDITQKLSLILQNRHTGLITRRLKS